MDEMINIKLEIPKAIIEPSREIKIRILLKDEDVEETSNDFICAQFVIDNNDSLTDCTMNNWKSKLLQFLHCLGFREKNILSLITDAVDLAIKSKNPKRIFSRLAKNNREVAKQMHNMIGNKMNTREVSRLIYETFERSFTPQHLVEYLYDIINSQIEDAS